MAQESGNSHADTDLVVGINGKYLVVPVPRFDPKNSDHQHAFRRGVRDALTRNGQVAEKKGELAKFAAEPKLSFESEGPTIASMRDEIARAACHAALLDKNPTLNGGVKYNRASAEAQDGTVSLSLPGYMRKYAAQIEAALAAKIAAGYTPKQRGTGGEKATGAAVTVDFE